MGKITLELNHPAPDEMILHANKNKHYHSSSWPIDAIRKLGWEDKDDAILCIHYCYDGDGKAPVGVVIEMSPNQPKPPPPPETKSPPLGASAEALKKLCEACGQQNEQANLHCIHCGAPFPNPKERAIPE